MLRPLQEMFQSEDYPDLLVGLGAPDDAAVWRLDESRSLVVTTDFFTPVVDDAYDYGAIAAANSLSDLYAMGAKPFLALNIAAMPPDLSEDIVQEIFRGGAEKVKESGAVVAGGHTIQDPEPKFGLVGIGMCLTEQMMTKGGAQPGDVLVLTKPIGTGVTSTALKGGKAVEADVREAVEWMTHLNASASELALRANVRGATDVTGYGLLGHGYEIAQASGVNLIIHLLSVPLLSGAEGYVWAGFVPGGSADNMAYFGPSVVFEESIDEYARYLLFDAQTSGGLLLAVSPSALPLLLEDASKQDIPIWPIGEVREGEGIEVAKRPFRVGPSNSAKGKGTFYSR